MFKMVHTGKNKWGSLEKKSKFRTLETSSHEQVVCCEHKSHVCYDQNQGFQKTDSSNDEISNFS